MAGGRDDRGIFGATRLVLHDLLHLQKIGKADDRVERRPQLMADIGEKALARFFRPVGKPLCVGDLLFALRLLRDIANQAYGRAASPADCGIIGGKAARPHLDDTEDRLVELTACAAHSRCAKAQHRRASGPVIERVRHRLQKCGTIGEMQALVEASAGKVAIRRASRSTKGRNSARGTARLMRP